MCSQRLLLIDPNPCVRRALLVHLVCCPEISIVGETAEVDEAIRLASHLQPDTVLLEPKRLDAVPLVCRLRELAPDSRIVIFTSYRDSREERALLIAGATTYLLKTFDLNTLWPWLTGAAPRPTAGHSQ